jgi:hypothetical protein
VVRIVFVADMAYIINKYKTLLRHREKGQNIDEFIYDVLQKCNDNDVEIVENFGRIKVMTQTLNRDIEKQIKSVLENKNISFETPTKEDLNGLRKAIVREYIDNQNKKEMEEDGEDPFS